MPAFYWHKGAPGDYYLYDRPRSDFGNPNHRPHIGRVSSATWGFRAWVDLNGERQHIDQQSTTPKNMMRAVECEILLTEPGATFTAENF